MVWDRYLAGWVLPDASLQHSDNTPPYSSPAGRDGKTNRLHVRTRRKTHVTSDAQRKLDLAILPCPTRPFGRMSVE